MNRKMNTENMNEKFNEFFYEAFESNTYKVGKRPWWQILVLTIIVMFLYFFFTLPSLSPQSFDFYKTIIIGIIVYWVLHALFGKQLKSSKGLKSSIVAIILLIAIPFLGTLISSPFFFSKQYAELIEINSSDFAKDIEQVSINQVPVVDREAARVIGEKQMGSMGELVSQFNVANKYSQVNIAGKPIRVSPLEYYDIIKYFTNNQSGIQHYVSVDMTSQDGDLTKLDEAIFYSESDILFRDLNRHIRFQFPFSILGESNFEIDDNGKAWYVTPVLHKPIFFFGGLDAKGAIITDANTGKSTYYKRDEVPSWVDRVNPAEVIISQLNSYGKYNRGFWNSVFSQKNVTSTTEGYNYISLGEDIYLTTGVTSVRSDESNLGFYYVNLRTKETKFYPVPSATETAAMKSARGKVQEKNYEPTFPVILNLGGRPVYFMSLKDQSLTAKMFALVDAEQFTDVIVGDNVQETISKYFDINPEVSSDSNVFEDEKITVDKISEVVVNGNTIYYLSVKENNNIYVIVPEELDNRVHFIQANDKLNIQSSLQLEKDEFKQFKIVKIEY